MFRDGNSLIWKWFVILIFETYIKFSTLCISKRDTRNC